MGLGADAEHGPWPPTKLLPSPVLKNVKYEIRGPLNRRADELISQGIEITKLNIGNPGPFGFRTPAHIEQAVIDHIKDSEGYVHQKGIMSARKAIVEHYAGRGITGTDAEHVYLGNGCSELIMMCQRGLLNRYDEVLVPSPDYPLWTASVVIHDATPVHYPCKVENGFIPQIEDLEALVTPRTRALVVISPNNPTGAVYPEETQKKLVEFAERHHLLIYSDEIYDEMLYEGTQHMPLARFVTSTIIATFGGLSKVFRACGFRVGWVIFSGKLELATKYFEALDLLSALRLCANAPGQQCISAALTARHDIVDLTSPGGRLYQTRQAVIEGVKKSKYLTISQPPMGAMYVFIGVDTKTLPDFDDHKFAMDLLEKEHVLVTPGRGFNVKYTNHFRVTLLPSEDLTRAVFDKMERVLDSYAEKLASDQKALNDIESLKLNGMEIASPLKQEA